MTIASFLLVTAMVVGAVAFTVGTGKSYWSLIFGGVGVSTVVGTLIWKPYERAFRATILAQQIEMIHVRAVTTFRGTTDISKRDKACEEAIDALQTLSETFSP